MAGDEHQAQQVVGHPLALDHRVEVGLATEDGTLLLLARLMTEQLELALEPLAPADPVDGLVPRGRHEPGTGVRRDARLRPLPERGDEGVLREFLGQADVIHQPGQAGDDPGRLEPPDRVYGAVYLGNRHQPHQSITGSRPAIGAADYSGP